MRRAYGEVKKDKNQRGRCGGDAEDDRGGV